MYALEDCIAAVATPPGEGGVAIVRISGPGAVAVGDAIFSGPVKKFASHTLHWGRVVDERGETVDEALLVVMERGRSYTGDETVEIQGHGGAVAQSVLEQALRAGARPALPGEFTYRAFLNGRLDLAQAEAVQTLIAARGSRAAAIAQGQLKGRLSESVREFQRGLVEVLAILEAWVDFPEEGLEFTSLERVSADLEAIQGRMRQLADTFERGQLLVDGATLCLVGGPNVGKSSLLNALLRRERAIVTPVAGTTRDLVEETFNLNGFALRLIDTAGIRKTRDAIEREGIRRSREALARADLPVLVLDATRGLQSDDRELLDGLPERSLVVWNKSDLAPAPEGLAVSAKTGDGLDVLTAAMEQLLCSTAVAGEVTLTARRHREALDRAVGHLQAVLDGLRGDLSPEFLCLDLRSALHSLGTILGIDVTEDVLTSIFSKFCIGK